MFHVNHRSGSACCHLVVTWNEGGSPAARRAASSSHSLKVGWYCAIFSRCPASPPPGGRTSASQNFSRFIHAERAYALGRRLGGGHRGQRRRTFDEVRYLLLGLQGSLTHHRLHGVR